MNIIFKSKKNEWILILLIFMGILIFLGSKIYKIYYMEDTKSTFAD